MFGDAQHCCVGIVPRQRGTKIIPRTAKLCRDTATNNVPDARKKLGSGQLAFTNVPNRANDSDEPTFAFVAAALRGPSTKYGDASFAKAPQLVQEGYASVLKLKDQLDSEIVFAKFGEPKDKNAIYYKPGPGVQKPHALFIAPSGSGKTSGFVILNVLRFNGSCVVLDIKGEIFQTTGARRAAMGDEVFVFDPENPEKSHSYNPLRRAARADNLDRRWEEVIQVATQMFDTPSSSAQGFLGGVEGMFCAMAMLAIKRKRPYISEILRLVKTTKQKDYEKMAEEVGYARAADEFLNLAAEESKILRSTISVMNNSGLQL